MQTGAYLKRLSLSFLLRTPQLRAQTRSLYLYYIYVYSIRKYCAVLGYTMYTQYKRPWAHRTEYAYLHTYIRRRLYETAPNIRTDSIIYLIVKGLMCVRKDIKSPPPSSRSFSRCLGEKKFRARGKHVGGGVCQLWLIIRPQGHGRREGADRDRAMVLPC